MQLSIIFHKARNDVERGDMNVWLFKIGEQTPLDKGDPKLSRTAMLAEEFSKNGHQVVWWMSTYDHLTKSQRSFVDIVVEVRPGYQVRMLYSPGYQKNVSLQRLLDHHVFDRRLKKEIQGQPKPDVIIAAYPTIGACEALVRYALARGIPIFIDARDMWPDIFREYLPQSVRWLYPLLFNKQISAAQFIFGKATGIVSITDEFIDWALTYTQRKRCTSDYVAALAYNKVTLPPDKVDEGAECWKNLGVTKEDQVICFFGVLSKKIDLRPVARAIPALSKKFPRLKLVVCGSGDEMESLESLFTGCDNVLFPGWVDKVQILTLMQISSLGLAPYVADRPDFLISLPTKIIEYFAGALPVITSLKGVSLRVVTDNQCGAYYYDSESFVEAVSSFLGSSLTLDAAKERARNLYEEDYRSEVVYGGVRNHIEQQITVKTA